MSPAPRWVVAAASALVTLSLAACSSPAAPEQPGSPAPFEPITIEHAFGTTVIEDKPERIATVAWANHEVPLALGVVPVGMAAADFGDDDGDGVLPWVSERLTELGATMPVLFDEGDGIDFEGVADARPDVILASYSGLTRSDYDTLTKIAPVVAYPENAWGTDWREMVEHNSAGMGVPEQGRQLIGELETEMADRVAGFPTLQGKSVAFMTHVDPTDLSRISFYSTHDTRVKFFEDLGLTQPQSIRDASAKTAEFAIEVSTEQADVFDDIDVIVTYGDAALLQALAKDPVLSQIPAVADGAVVVLPSTEPVGTAANPTPLAISWVLEDYLDLLAEAAGRAR